MQINAQRASTQRAFTFSNPTLETLEQGHQNDIIDNIT